jgi:hypothetical protein
MERAGASNIALYQMNTKVRELCLSVLESAVETDDIYDSGILE